MYTSVLPNKIQSIPDSGPQAAWYDLTLARGILCHPEARETLTSEGGGRVHAHLHHALDV